MSQTTPKLDDLRIDRPTRAAPRSRLPWFLALAVLAVLVAAWWLRRAPAGIEVRTVAAREAGGGSTASQTVLNASGYVVARRAATVSSKVMGKVVDVHVEEGLAVKSGDVLARLDDTNAQASLQLSRAQLAAAGSVLEESRVRLREAEQEFQRQSSLKQTSVATQADYDRAEAAVLAWRARLAQQQAELTVAERSVAVWQQQLEDTVIRAPFAGIVTSKNAQPGEMISPMASGGFTRTGICTIVDMQSLEVEIDVNESYLHRVAPGQPVEATLDAYPEWKIPCKVIAIIPTADRQKSTVKVRVGFNQFDPRILPEMGVKVAFRESAKPAAAPAAARRDVLVPKSALRNDGGRDVVFVLQNGRAERRAVTVAGTQAEDLTLSAGVTAGERVIVEAGAELADGAAAFEKEL